MSDPDYKAILSKYHNKLMEVRKTCSNLQNEYPTQRTGALATECMNFIAVVGELDAELNALK